MFQRDLSVVFLNFLIVLPLLLIKVDPSDSSATFSKSYKSTRVQNFAKSTDKSSLNVLKTYTPRCLILTKNFRNPSKWCQDKAPLEDLFSEKPKFVKIRYRQDKGPGGVYISV